MLRHARVASAVWTIISVSVALPMAAQTKPDSTLLQHSARAPISIGNYPNVLGLRLNFRDRDLERVRGVNVTLWSPYKPSSGVVRGLAVGMPSTGAQVIHGVSVAPFGVSASRELQGIALGGLGVGTGGSFTGIAAGGIGVGGNGPMSGIMLAGIGAGSSGSVRGVMIGGVGVATGGTMRGIALGGIGAGIARDLTGIAIGGVGVGVAGHARGITIGGIGTGVGGNLTGIAISGIGTAAGGMFKGIGVSGVAVAAGILRGGFVAPYVASIDAHGIILAPVLFRVQPNGNLQGISVSAVNAVRGSQRGLSIGLVNYARTLRGGQIGLINIISTSKSHKVLPIFNWGSTVEK